MFAETVKFKGLVGLQKGFQHGNLCFWVGIEPISGDVLDPKEVELKPHNDGSGDLIGVWSGEKIHDSGEKVSFKVSVVRHVSAGGELSMNAFVKLDDQSSSFNIEFSHENELVFPRTETYVSNRNCKRAVLILKGI